MTMPDKTISQHQVSVAEAYLSHLQSRDIDYLYVGAGSDTAPIVEAYSRAAESGHAFPKPVISAHETVAVGMAHGYTMVTGKIQAVMLHVSVGAANAVCGIMNAARANVPILFTAGRTPVFEEGPLGSRNSEIHWAQEMFDQAGMMRELIKWDYELRDGLQMPEVVDRAISVATAHPQAPVYLTLPREVLASPAAQGLPALRPLAPVSAPAPQEEAVRTLAAALMAAEAPVFMCTASGADAATVAMLVALCERFGIGVGESRPRYVSFPDSHPLHMGHDQRTIYEHADALVFLESDVPWIPAKAKPAKAAFVAHVGVDPLFSRYPVRSHRSDLSVTSTVRHLLTALSATLEAMGAKDSATARTQRLKTLAAAQRTRVQGRAAADREQGGPITKAFMSTCLGQALPDGAIVVNEYPLIRECIPFEKSGLYFSHSASAGLGWGFPAALGARQAAPDRQVIAFMGDGSYMFANPAACHHASAFHDLPIVVVIFNNGGWGAVQNAALDVYPPLKAGNPVVSDTFVPLSCLDPLPDFGMYAEASGGLSLRVTERSELLSTLRHAFEASRLENRQVLVNVIGQG